MIDFFEDAAERRKRAEDMLRALAAGMGRPSEVVALWRRIVDAETDPRRRAEAMVNLASALDYLGDDGRAQAIAITDQAIKVMGAKHRDAAGVFMMAAQRLAMDVQPSAADSRKALDYLHAALAASTAHDRALQASVLLLYARLAPSVGDYSKIDKAQHLLDRLRRLNLGKHEAVQLIASMAEAHHKQWQAASHRPSLHKAISLSADALALCPTGPDVEVMRSGVQQQRALLLLERYTYKNDGNDFEAAVALLREAARLDAFRPQMLNSLAIALMGTDSRPATDPQFEEARLALVEGLASTNAPESTAFLKWTEANWNLAAYQRGGPVSHLDRAVDAADMASRQAEILGSQPLLTLAQALYDRFRAGGDMTDIDRAAQAAEQGLSLCPVDDVKRWSSEVTTANIYQERALKNGVGYDPVDAARAVELQQAALSRLVRGSLPHTELASTALGTQIEQHEATKSDHARESARAFARMLPSSPSEVARLPAVAAVNLAAFYLKTVGQPVDREAWMDVLRTVASRHPDGEGGWLAASNLMHQNVGRDWNAVVEAFDMLARQRGSRLAAARTPRERAMVLRREQSVAALAGLALVHLDRPEEAARLIDATQAALLMTKEQGSPLDDPAIWSSFDALFYPATTRYGAYAIAITADGATARILPDLAPARPDASNTAGDTALTTAASLLQAAFDDRVPERLLVVPVGELGLLPWAAAPVGSGVLIDETRLSILPTRRLWKAREPRLETLLVVEAAEVQGSPALRHAAAETAQLRAWLPSGTDLKGSDATPGAAMAALPRADVAHFSCHGVIDPVEPMRSRLLVEDGVISVSDVLGADCTAVSLVSLSACQSGLHAAGLADEFASLAVAFLVSGAQFAVGTLWNIQDAAASLFSRRLFEQLSQGAAPREAVRSAQLWMRDSADEDKALWLSGLGPPQTPAEETLRSNLARGGDRRSFAAAKYWAGFACYG